MIIDMGGGAEWSSSKGFTFNGKIISPDRFLFNTPGIINNEDHIGTFWAAYLMAGHIQSKRKPMFQFKDIGV